MRPILLVLILQFLFVSIGCSKNTEEKIIAEVGSYKITLEQFQSRYEKFLRSSGIRDNIIARKKVVDYMIDEILLFRYDDNKSIFENETYQNELTWLKSQAILGYLKDREVYAKITATDSEMRKAFQRQNEKLAVSHLYARTKEEADELYGLLQAGVDFEKLASNVFSDSTLKSNGGYLGYFEWGEMDPNFEETAYKMKIGEISKPVETENGYSIIKLIDRISNPLLTEFDYQKNISQLTRAVRMYKKRPSEKAFVNQVIDLNKIQVNSKSLDNLYESFSFSSPSNKLNDEEMNDEICINYNNRNYVQSEIAERINALPIYHKEKITSKERLATVLKGFVLNDELMKIAEDKGYEENEEVLKTFETLKSNYFMQIKKAEITRNASIEDSIVYQFYLEHLDFFSTHDEINIAEILVKEESSAKNILSKINRGEDFGTLAEKYSLRDFSAANKGIIGFAPRSKFGNLNNLFWNSEVNEIVGPVKIEEYWGIFKVLEKRESQPIEFEKVKNEAALAAKYFIQNEIFEKYVNRLKSESNLVSINYDLIASYKQVLASVN